MLKKLSAGALALGTYLSLAVPSFAQVTINPCPKNQTAEGVTNFNPLCNLTFEGGGLVQALITAAFVIATLIALAFLIFGGIKWVMSGGDKTKVEEARGTIVAALVGLVIVFLSYLILNLVFNFFNLGDLGSLRIPRLSL